MIGVIRYSLDSVLVTSQRLVRAEDSRSSILIDFLRTMLESVTFFPRTGEFSI